MQLMITTTEIWCVEYHGIRYWSIGPVATLLNLTPSTLRSKACNRSKDLGLTTLHVNTILREIINQNQLVFGRGKALFPEEGILMALDSYGVGGLADDMRDTVSAVIKQHESIDCTDEIELALSTDLVKEDLQDTKQPNYIPIELLKRIKTLECNQALISSDLSNSDTVSNFNQLIKRMTRIEVTVQAIGESLTSLLEQGDHLGTVPSPMPGGDPVESSPTRVSNITHRIQIP